MVAAGTNATAARALRAFVQTRGMRVRLRVALPASVGDASEELGLASPGFEDREIGRGVFRKAHGSRVLLVEAECVTAALLASAVGVVIGAVLYRIEACEALRAGDGVYGYALTLAAAQTMANG